MERKHFKSMYKILIAVAIVAVVTICVMLISSSFLSAAVNTNPTWYVGERLIYHGQAKPYDYYAAKDPTIVYSGGKYHVFYTGANQSGGWQMLYTSASTLDGLKNAQRTYLSKIGESYFCAPQVFYFEPHGLWYLIYQDGTYGAAYATSSNIADPNSWSGPKKLSISGNTGLDYYVICDDNYAYLYNSPNDRNVYVRKTTLANFPNGWGSPSVAISNTWEGHNIYKSLADGKYYLISEDYTDNRHYELYTSSSAGGPWTLLNDKWAYRGNLSYTADKWTTNVSHGELIRAGVNQKMEINDINRVDFLIQGTNNTSGEYQQIVWDLGVIRNYTGSSSLPSSTTSTTTTTSAQPSTSSGTSTTISNGTYTIKNRNSGKLMEVANASTADGGNVQQFSSNGHNCQKWRLQATDSGYYKIFNVNSGKLLEVQYASTSEGANIAQWSDTGDYCQQWRFVSVGNGYYSIVNRRSGKAIDVYNWSTADGGNNCQWTVTSANNQLWTLTAQ